MIKNNSKKVVKGKESWRDLAITKKCKICGEKFHPRKKNTYYTGKYCSVICGRKGAAKNFINCYF